MSHFEIKVFRILKRKILIHHHNYRLQEERKVQPVDLATELSALHININSVHDTLGSMCKECEVPPETKPSVNSHLLYVCNENQVCKKNIKKQLTIVNNLSQVKFL